ncbi:hypothetical protein RJ639_001628 [Escallonia herrerae]|uniref:Protein SMG7 n=1 Tax=Escallonia herrerae TaxID=1293975 RepID=A0AA88XIT7_9ASTE|nr:hypothetical protein RJ639_001628 [Escallonia herrerae]
MLLKALEWDYQLPITAVEEACFDFHLQNVELENRRRKAAQARIPSDPNAWQQIRENYEVIVLEDDAFSEQHEVEYALWQLHYRRIEELRAHYNAALASASQNGKVPTRPGPDRVTKIRSQFKTFLSEATGFYHDLMIKIRAKYGLQLGYFSDDPENQASFVKDGTRSMEIKKGLLSCHRCLIYLGDLARYKGLYGEGDSKARDFAAASSYYMQASSLWPSSGNPHHQLAIVANYSGDELVAVYRYFRSLAAENPFSTARDNLIIAFEKNRQSYSQLPGNVRASTVRTTPVRITGKGRGKGETRFPVKDNKVEAIVVKGRASSLRETFRAFSIRFVRLNGILFTRTSLETFGEVFSLVKSDLLELLSSGPEEEYNFGSDSAECRLLITRVIAILIFTVDNVHKETENQSYAEILQRSVLLQNAFTAVFEVMGHILERCIQLKDPSASYLLPGIMIFVEWLACRQDIAVGSELEERQASTRSFFWNHYVSFLNKLLVNDVVAVDEDEDRTCFFNMSKFDEGETANRLALTEDFELRGFLPLLPAQLILDFSRKHNVGSDGGNKEKKARIQRIIAAGKALTNLVPGGQQAIYFNAKSKRFSIGVEPQSSDDYSLASSLEISVSNDLVQESPEKSQTTFSLLQQKALFHVEGEEEDEVIVFKPSATEKHVDLKAPTSEVLGTGLTVSQVDMGNNVGSVAVSHGGFPLENSLNTISSISSSYVNSTAHYLQPTQSTISSWLEGEHAFLANGLANVNMLEKGFSSKTDLPDQLRDLQPATVAVPFSHSIGLSNRYSPQVTESGIPSKFDSPVSSKIGADSPSMKPSSFISAGLKKNPVSRPTRRSGPPPGFNTVPLKPVDEPFTLKNETQVTDDYRWLDGYQLPSTSPSFGFNNPVNNQVQAYHPASKNTDSMGISSFPFPGKQVPPASVSLGNQNGWQEYQFPENLKFYQEHQQRPPSKGNQPSLGLPQHYQGQSLWEGRFFV